MDLTEEPDLRLTYGCVWRLLYAADRELAIHYCADTTFLPEQWKDELKRSLRTLKKPENAQPWSSASIQLERGGAVMCSNGY